MVYSFDFPVNQKPLFFFNPFDFRLISKSRLSSLSFFTGVRNQFPSFSRCALTDTVGFAALNVTLRLFFPLLVQHTMDLSDNKPIG